MIGTYTYVGRYTAEMRTSLVSGLCALTLLSAPKGREQLSLVYISNSYVDLVGAFVGIYPFKMAEIYHAQFILVSHGLPPPSEAQPVHQKVEVPR